MNDDKHNDAQHRAATNENLLARSLLEPSESVHKGGRQYASVHPKIILPVNETRPLLWFGNRKPKPEQANKRQCQDNYLIFVHTRCWLVSQRRQPRVVPVVSATARRRSLCSAILCENSVIFENFYARRVSVTRMNHRTGTGLPADVALL